MPVFLRWFTLVALTLAFHGRAGSFPTKPVKVIVPFSPGGGSDTFVRILQSGIQANQLLGQPFTVINVPGAGGTIGSRRAKGAFPDGHTILNLHDGILSAKHSGQALYGAEAFEPIAATGRSGTLICVSDEAPYQTLAEVLAAARKNPGSVSFGANFGATSYFAGRMLEQVYEGAEFNFVPAGGGAKRFAAMKGGHLDVSTFTVSEYLGFQAGGLRAVALLGAERHPAFPEVMTAREQGIDVDWDLIQYWWAPKGTPPERIARLAAVLREAMATPEVAAKFKELYVDPLFVTGPELTRLIGERDAKVARLSVRQAIELPDFPMMIGMLLVVVGGVAAWRGGRPAAMEAGTLKALAGLGLSLGVYVLALQSGRVAYVFATMVFMFALGAWLMRGGQRRWSALAVTACGVSGLCQVVFTRWLIVDLP